MIDADYCAHKLDFENIFRLFAVPGLRNMIKEILFKLVTLVNDSLFFNVCLERLDMVQQTVPSCVYLRE